MKNLSKKTMKHMAKRALFHMATEREYYKRIMESVNEACNKALKEAKESDPLKEI